MILYVQGVSRDLHLLCAGGIKRFAASPGSGPSKEAVINVGIA